MNRKQVLNHLFFVTLMILAFFKPDLASAGIFDKIYDVQKKAIGAAQKGVEHAGKELYDEKKKAIAKIQDHITAEEKKQLEDDAKNRVEEFITKMNRQLEALAITNEKLKLLAQGQEQELNTLKNNNSGMVSQLSQLKISNEEFQNTITKQRFQIDSLTNTNLALKREADKLSQQLSSAQKKFWATLAAVIIAILGILKLILEIRKVSLENTKLKMDLSKQKEQIGIGSSLAAPTSHNTQGTGNVSRASDDQPERGTGGGKPI